MSEKLKYEEMHKEINGVLCKLCTKCKQWFPCTKEYFYKNKSNKRDGLHTYCKKCSIQISGKTQNENKEHVKQVKAKWFQNNYKRIYKEHKEHYWENNKERLSVYGKQYRTEHPEKFKQYSKNRQHKNHKITKEEWIKCKEYFNNQCAYCGLSIEEHYIKFKGEIKLGDFHKEHVDDKGGNDLSNCVPSCNRCNQKKKQKSLEEWYNPKNKVYSKDRLDKILKWINEDYNT